MELPCAFHSYYPGELPDGWSPLSAVVLGGGDVHRLLCPSAVTKSLHTKIYFRPNIFSAIQIFFAFWQFFPKFLAQFIFNKFDFSVVCAKPYIVVVSYLFIYIGA